MTACVYNIMQVRFYVIEKSSGKVVDTHYISQACFVFHHINAYEEDGIVNVVTVSLQGHSHKILSGQVLRYKINGQCGCGVCISKHTARVGLRACSTRRLWIFRLRVFLVHSEG